MSVVGRATGVRGEKESASTCVACSLQACFHESPYPALREIESKVDDGVAKLEGTVSSYYLKQIAQEIALQHEGVRMVNNQVQVG